MSPVSDFTGNFLCDRAASHPSEREDSAWHPWSGIISHARCLTRAQACQLVDLHRLLTLEHVSDPDRIEARLFAPIDPASVFVEECCLLLEKLGALLQSIAENDPTDDGLHVAPDGIPKVA